MPDRPLHRRIFAHFRGQAVGYIALFFALGVVTRSPPPIARRSMAASLRVAENSSSSPAAGEDSSA